MYGIPVMIPAVATQAIDLSTQVSNNFKSISVRTILCDLKSVEDFIIDHLTCYTAKAIYRSTEENILNPVYELTLEFVVMTITFLFAFVVVVFNFCKEQIITAYGYYTSEQALNDARNFVKFMGGLFTSVVSMEDVVSNDHATGVVPTPEFGLNLGDIVGTIVTIAVGV